MNRYDIKNIKSGIITHSYTGKSAMPAQPEWGSPERLKWKDEASPDEIADSIGETEIEIRPAIPANPLADPPTPDMPALTRKQIKLPQTYQVTVSDISANEQAETDRQTQIKTLNARIKALAGQADLTVADVKEAIFKLIKRMGLNKDLD